MTKTELNKKYFTTEVKLRAMGKGRAPKRIVNTVLRDGMDYLCYLRELRDIDPHAYGMWLCRNDHEDFMTDRWWDTDEAREESIRWYRGHIREIRMKYGLTKSEVAEFMRVG